MYFIEKIIRIFIGSKNHKNTYKPIEIDDCEHMFLPLDSSGEYLACSKCGKVIKKEDIQK